MTTVIKKIKLREGCSFASLDFDQVHDDMIRDPGTAELNHAIHDDFKRAIQLQKQKVLPSVSNASFVQKR